MRPFHIWKTINRIHPTNPILGQQIFINKLREQFFELRGFGVVDVVNDIGKPFMGIDLILFAGAEETVKHGDVLSRFMDLLKIIIIVILNVEFGFGNLQRFNVDPEF
jgi:hypothetical protein